MKRNLVIAAIAVFTCCLASGEALAQKKPDIDPTVTFATSWEEAVDEAKLLNVPIVVHSHGFF